MIVVVPGKNLALAPCRWFDLALMRFSVLGALEVSLNGGRISVGGRKQRTLLAVLLLHANRVVSRGELVQALWGEHPPPSVAESLDAYVYRLRKQLGPGRLLREAGGYLLTVEPGELDVDRFEQLIGTADRAAETGDHTAAGTALTEALALWHGSAWVDLLDEPLAGIEARRLDELRLGAVESRIEAELVSGRGAELVPELERLVAEQPLREGLRCHLMLALYRAGRQTDALDVFRAARDRLVNELGLEPGRELQELQRRILQHDPTLAEPRRVLVARGSTTKGAIAGVSAAALLGVVVAALLLGSGASHARRALPRGANGLLALSTGAREITTAAPLPAAPTAVATAAGSVWVADAGSGTVSRIDRRSGAVVQRIHVDGTPASIVSGNGALWVASTVGAKLVRIDPATEAVTQEIALPGSRPGALAFGQNRLWVADSAARQLFAIDPSSGSLTRTVSLDVQPSAVAVASGAVWIAAYDDAAVEKLDPSTGRAIGRVRVGNGPVALAVQSGSLWVANSLDSTISRIDPRTLAVRATIPVGSGPSALATNAGSIWVANRYSHGISRIEPRRNEVAGTVLIGGQPTSLASGMGKLWVGVAASDTSHRGGTLVLVATDGFGSVDPAFFNLTGPPQFGGLAYDTLVTFQHTDGEDGLRLVPDLAVAIPTPSDGGATYAFRIHPRIRYSDGRIVQASDFRRAIERLFRLGSPGSSYFAGIIGAAACTRQSQRCDLSRGIATDDAAGTVVFQLARPDPNFLFKLTEQDFASPIPPGTPDHEPSSGAPPGTGPYTIARADRTEVRFVRNPYFREWSHAAQPDGNPDNIVWRFVASQRDAATEVEQGRGDWIYGLIPSAQHRRLRLEDPARLHSNTLFEVDFVHLNTHRAPFDDIRVRRALNYAIDRAKVARLYGGRSFATPTCQPLAPGLPGYSRYCPFTLHPRPNGAWTAPNLARAKQLVSASGTRAERVDLWGEANDAYIPRSVPVYVAHVLRSLGYRTHLHLAPIASITQAMRRRHQLSADGDWLADYPDPSSYIPQFFACGGGNGNGYYCDPQLDRKMREASLLDPHNAAKATAVWAAIDHQLTDEAAWVPTVNVRDVELVSRRLHNFQYNPIWGFLADQAWLQ